MIQLEIGEFLGFCDMNGVDALNSEQIQKLEEYISACNEAHNQGKDLVVDAIYDRLMEVLRVANPMSELCQHIWEDSVDELEDTDSLFKSNPMYSIQTIKSYSCQELKDYINRLPDDSFDAHVSVKLNGHGIRLKYQNGRFIQARSRARASAGKDLTPQLEVVLERDGLEEIDSLSDMPLCEIRGEWVLPLGLLNEARAKTGVDIVSAFTAVSCLGKASGTKEEWGMLHFVAYEFVADGVSFSTKSEEYEYLSELGFEIPLYFTYPDMQKESLIEELKQNVAECENVVTDEDDPYEYYTDGLVFTIDNTSLFKRMGDDGGHYKYGNIALKVGYWQQDMYHGYVQTILWMKGKTKLSPVAIVAEQPDMANIEADNENCITNINAIKNYKSLGVVTASGNRVRKVPLYEPSNILKLDAYRGNILHFRYGGEAGVVPCMDDGSPLIDSKIKDILVNDYYSVDDEDLYDYGD